MIYVRIFVAAAIALLFGRPIEGAEPLVEKYRSSLVFLHPVAITSGGAEIALQSGSGFVISEEGYVLTSFHVIKPPDSNVQYDKVEVRGAVGSRFERQYPLEVVRSDPEADLLLLQLPWL